MTRPALRHNISVEEYLSGEDGAEIRHEYIGGRVYAMTGASDRETYYRRQPCLIVEVLSDSTERLDRREKLLAYQTLPSLREYLLVAQDERLLQIHRRDRDWEAEIIAEGAIRLDCLDCDLDLDVVYETVL